MQHVAAELCAHRARRSRALMRFDVHLRWEVSTNYVYAYYICVIYILYIIYM